MGRLEVHLGGHPVPSEDSINATKSVSNSLPSLNANDLVFVLISGGGGSALFTQPVEVTGHAKKFEVLLKCGADINEINTLRKHLDQVKGVVWRNRLQPAMVRSFYFCLMSLGIPLI